MDVAMKEKLHFIIENYKENFEQIDKEERYKWEAIAWYKEHWNIEADNFAGMLTDAFSKAKNLLNAGYYYPYKVIVEFAQEHPEKVKNLFRTLHDESLPLLDRFIIFEDAAKERLKELQVKDSKVKNHYQDLRAVMVYLTFQYPEKYYLFKSTMYTAFRNRIGYIEDKAIQKSKISEYEHYKKLCEFILDEVKNDDELIAMNKARLNENCYQDGALHLLTMDIVYFGSKDHYWPSLDEYNPKLTKEDWIKFLTEIEMPDHPSPMQMLKAMMELGGEATCKKLSEKYGGKPSRYVGCSVNLGKRAMNYFKLPSCMDGDKERVFVIPFVGRYVIEDGNKNYSYKIRPELYAALKELDLSGCYSHVKDKNYDDDCKVPSVTDINLNTILYGPPGTGKTYNTAIYAVAICNGEDIETVKARDYADVMKQYKELIESEQIAFTTFHQSYGYEEFIEGIKPKMNQEGNDIGYEIKSGVFKQFCEKAKNFDEPHVFIIDEINRGNISKIFGELITLIEDTKRAGEKEAASAILPYSGESFSIPSNVYIIGTMNTADRSIALMDTALRRRFSFVEMMPDAELLNGINIDGINIGEMLNKINKRIEYLYDREHTIGHAFFMKLRKDNVTIDDLATIFEKSIIPLLQEYFYEDYQKIRLVLGDNGKENEAYQFIKAVKTNVNDVFKGSVDFDLPDNIYSINKDAFKEAQSYIQIYQ